MKRLKKAYIIFLALIFAFPLIFQSIHIFQHHKHSHHSSHICHSHHSFHHHHENDYEFQVTHDHCFICEYEFTVLEEITYDHISFQIKKFILINTILNSEFIHAFNGVDLNLRAPPAIFF